MCDHCDAESLVVQGPREKDVKDGKYSQVLASGLDDKLCGDLEGLKKIWARRGICHFGDLGSKIRTTLRPQLTVAAP